MTPASWLGDFRHASAVTEFNTTALDLSTTALSFANVTDLLATTTEDAALPGDVEETTFLDSLIEELLTSTLVTTDIEDAAGGTTDLAGPSNSEATTTADGGAAGEADGGGTAGEAPAAPPPKEEPPPCSLLSSSFGWWLQAFLGAACFVSLVGKRFTDKVRRPWKIWFFDTSKQAISAFVVHILNILLSMAFGRWLDVKADPCNWYWINLTLDDTLGVAVQFLLLRTLQHTYRLKCVGRPELAMSGEYGDPPDVKIFGRQLLDWQGLVVLQKTLFIVLVVKFTRQIAAVARALLGWLDPFPRAKLVVVMVLTPLTMNVFALWMADSFLQGEANRPRADEEQVDDPFVHNHQRGHASNGCGSPARVLGRRTAGSLPTTRGQNGDASGDDSDRVLGFQEWKRRAAVLGRGGRPMRIPRNDPGGADQNIPFHDARH